jgi:hypothetical protein
LATSNDSTIYICGNTGSANFPVSSDAYSKTLKGVPDDVFARFKLRKANSSGIGEELQMIPKEMKLFQNFPNPFNPSTTIQYSLHKSSRIRLDIYNLLGQKIKTFINSFQDTNEHLVVWDGTNDFDNPVNSGIYFYRLQANNLLLQKKMILTR